MADELTSADLVIPLQLAYEKFYLPDHIRIVRAVFLCSSSASVN